MVGAGYVGLTTAACLSDLGNEVCVVDIDQEKVRALRRYRVPFYEPGLREVMERNGRAGRLRFTCSYREAIPGAEFAFIAVATPEGANGEADLSFVERAAASIAQSLDGPLIVINKSTVPIGTGDVVSEVIRRHNAQFPIEVFLFRAPPIPNRLPPTAPLPHVTLLRGRHYSRDCPGNLLPLRGARRCRGWNAVVPAQSCATSFPPLPHRCKDRYCG